MDLNVCSRRVHDGYATIRTRGRGRPRAVYRSDSEEFLKDTGESYALFKLANLAESDYRVPRWSDLGEDRRQQCENYGTLRGSSRGRSGSPEGQKVILRTFSRKFEKPRSPLRSASVIKPLRVRGETCRSGRLDKVVATRSVVAVGSLEDSSEAVDGGVRCDVGKCEYDRGEKDDRIYDSVPLEDVALESGHPGDGVGNSDSSTRKPTHQVGVTTWLEEKKSSDCKNAEKDSTCSSSGNSGNRNKEKPVYAVPNVFVSERRPGAVDGGNYVPSGDLYRSTVKYIEDVNRNLAEIGCGVGDESVGKTKSGYGVINRIKVGDDQGNLYGYRKRDMAPMLPITPDFDENVVDDREATAESSESRGHRKIAPPATSHKRNSSGRLPPRLLPRSSSIENACRHSTGSTSTTTTTSSTRSTESLCAISESGKTARGRNDLDDAVDVDPETRTGPSDLVVVSSHVPSLTLSLNRRNSYYRQTSVDETRSGQSRGSSFPTERRNVVVGVLDEKRYGTLPCRRYRSKPLHKSSEDVLKDDEKSAGVGVGGRFRGCGSSSSSSSVTDVRDHRRHQEAREETTGWRVPVHRSAMMDATDVILKGQMERSRSGSGSGGGRVTLKLKKHHSFSTVEEQAGFAATLPRRTSFGKPKDQAAGDPLRRLSGNLPSTLEPLYEHAVSDPVKPRNTDQVIPWWELATRKFRHRSCPSLQAHVVSAFEQSLSNMTQRLQQLTATAEKKR